MKKPIMYLIILILLTNTMSAETINLNEEENPIIKQINSYEIISEIAKEYDNISIEVENYKAVLIFNESKLKEIQEYNNQTTDLNIKLSREDIIYLMENWNKMSQFDKIKFLIKTNLPIDDVLTFSGIAMGTRT